MTDKKTSMNKRLLLKEALLIIINKVRKLHKRVLEPKEDGLISLADHFSNIQLDKKIYPKQRIKAFRDLIIKEKKEIKQLKGDIQYLNELEESIKESLAV